MTQAAEQFLREGDVFTASGGRLAGRHAAFDSELRAAVRESADSLDHPDWDAWRMLRTDSPMSDTVAPTVFVSALVWMDASGERRPARLVVVNDPREHLTRSALKAAGLFGLTRAEGVPPPRSATVARCQSMRPPRESPS